MNNLRRDIFYEIAMAITKKYALHLIHPHLFFERNELLEVPLKAMLQILKRF